MNVGDAALIVIRAGKVVHRTIAHYDGMGKPASMQVPDQVGTLSTGLPVGELSSICHFSTFPLQHRDRIILGSDGIFDNVTEDSLVTLCACKPNASAANVAESVAKLAKRNWMKPDDISCVVIDVFVNEN